MRGRFWLAIAVSGDGIYVLLPGKTAANWVMCED
jgi:hypothetical protein